MEERTCPVDSTVLRRIERSGVHVDGCPTCRGIWLDRGELEKIVEREGRADDDFEREIAGGDRRSASGGDVKPKKKKRSMLEDLLGDFGG